MAAPSHLKSLQALEAAGRCGSLIGAAKELSITPAAVGQRIKALEDYLGVDLVTRGRRGLTLTPAAAAAIEHLHRAFRELEAAVDALDLQRADDIHVAAVSDFAELWLKPRLPAFRREHPNLRFCINGEGDAPLRLGVDCEITFGPARTDADTDSLFRDFVVPVGSPENTQRVMRAAEQDRLEGFPLLHLDFYRDDPAVPGWPRWVTANGLRRTAPERGIRFHRIAAVAEAVLADAGFALCGLALVADLIEDLRLSLPFGASTGVWSDHVFQARYRSYAMRPQIRRFRAWLAEEAAATRFWLDGVVGGATP
jgi:LysR family transcriptional regulator, glycine cleavage system transcriptional activator